jgi:hypothetical protein
VKYPCGEAGHPRVVGTRERVEAISGDITRITIEYRSCGCVTWRKA